MTTVAIVDDDAAHNAVVSGILRDAGYECVTFTSAELFLATLRRRTFDMLVIDWVMPGITGLEVVSGVRAASMATMPIVMVTGRSSEADIVQGLNAGADDYLVKPVSAPILLARADALLRRAYPANANQHDFGPYRFEPVTEKVFRSGQESALTSKEFQLALLFFRNLCRPLSRDFLLSSIWGQRSDVETRTLDTHVSRLRVKLALRPANGLRLMTVYGFGYRLEPCDPEASAR